ncbi:MarP family serine protease [Nonomuraea basaltis]|uniref:MarP family serine protease n=1 Tax=Nonomuraea basaltis TaxID=2495887 RepID=UPI00110C6175|nr:MarP family serine protease [Nonomuraea basaltis]TMR89974.1 MarP family serine protease [Nonomuraea basaltis]
MLGDLLDLVLLALLVAFGVSGYRQGFIVGAASFLGFVGGCVLGIYIAPAIAGAVVDGDVPESLLAIVIVLLTATMAQFGTSTVGAVLRSHVRYEPARILDGVGGTLISGLSVLVIAWLVGSLLVSSSLAPIVEQIRGSLLLATVDQAIPTAARDWQKPFKRFIDRSDFPPVLDAIAGQPTIDVPPPDAAVLKSAALQQARAGIVQVQGVASSCGKHITGTGFVYAPDHIMTNAHVVAGVDEELLIVDHERRPRPAAVVLYNPKRDVAVLHVPNLGLPTLTFDGRADRGNDAIIAGYPKGRGFTSQPARVAARQSVSIPDIYRESQVTRDVYLIRGKVEQGNSGGPLLARDGRVLGVVFASVTSQDDTGYVLTAAEVASDARRAVIAAKPVSTQTCD